MTAITEADSLRLKLELVTPELAGATSHLVEDPRVAQLYIDYLVACHGILRATIPLLEAARRGASGRHDDASRELAAYLAKHIDEEAVSERRAPRRGAVLLGPARAPRVRSRVPRRARA